MRAAQIQTVEAACKQAIAVLNENLRDIPFAALYVVADNKIELTARTSTEGRHLLPAAMPVSANAYDSPWPLAVALQEKRAVEVLGLMDRDIQVPGKSWPEPVRDALVVPMQAANDQLAGLLIVGVSPRRPLDAAYRTFFDLVAGHIGTAISAAQAYQAERKRADALAEIDRAKTTFLSNISHELQTPLTLMLGTMEEVVNRAKGPAMMSREDVDLLHRNNVHLLKLVSALLDFSRIEAGCMRASYEPTDLGAFTADLSSVFRSAVERAGLRLIVDCRQLPEPVYVDRAMWEKIVLNLLSNALKFTFQGEIAVSLCQRDASVELSVSDTGTGIPADEVPRVFEGLHRVEDAADRTYEGSGIRLALVRDLAKLHGGG